MKQLLLIYILTVFFSGHSQCDPNALITLQTRANQTDANISWELKKHYSFYNPTCTSQNTLVVHLVGSYDNPGSTLLFPTLAANKGFHVVSLKYPNSTAAQSACGNSSDPNCYSNFRKEIIEGIDYSTDVAVDTNDCITNRLLKLLQYLELNNPGQNWSNYFSGNNLIWNKIIISGHSQGGGHAALIAKTNLVKRVLMFASPNDYSTFFNSPATWTTTSLATPSSAFYGFNNTNDDVVTFSEQFEIWNNLGMASFGDSLDVIGATTNYNNTHQLITHYDTTGIGGNHSVMILDSKTPLIGSSQALFQPVWEYMLGDHTASIVENEPNNRLIIFPNPVENEFSVNVISNSEKTKLFIVDLSGKIVFKTTTLTDKINISHLNKGVYFVKVKDENEGVYTSRLIKK